MELLFRYGISLDMEFVFIYGISVYIWNLDMELVFIYEIRYGISVYI